LQEESEFDVDEEGASMFLQFEAERKVREFQDYRGDWTAGARDYLSYGCITFAKGQSSSIDSMFRRAQWLQRHDLHGQRDPASLRQRCDLLYEQQAALF
jgi:DNA sulfur modification protein DndC